jgi:hypothetical protein
MDGAHYNFLKNFLQLIFYIFCFDEDRFIFHAGGGYVAGPLKCILIIGKLG